MTTKSEASRSVGPPVLIAAGTFLSCVYGGYIVNEQTQLSPGFGTLISEIFGGSNAPVLAHTIFGLPIIAALIWSLFGKRIQQVPGQTFSAIWLLFFLFIGASAFFSSFRVLSLTIWAEWLVYGAAVFAVVACLGRNRGPLLALGAIAAGTAVVALRGLMEYGQMRGTDASWRIFAGWVNPNATAAILLAGFFVSLGLCLAAERLPSLMAGLATVLIAFAIFLTGSKGGVSLGLPLGTIAFAVCLSRSKGGAMATLVTISLVLTALIGVLFLKNVGWLGLAISGLFAIAVIALTGDRPSRKNQCIRLASTYVAAFVLVLLLSISTAAKTDAPAPVSSVKGSAQISTPVPAATPIARIAQGGGSQEQSATFRLNLWKSALHLIKSRPLTGYGMGSYRYESARAGLTTSTVFAHNTFLQIWAEGGIVSFGLILAGIAVWFLTVLKNRSQLPIARLAPFAGIVAAVIALLAHSMVDSDLYYFGIGICFFVLLGVGLLLSVDSVAPEFMPKPVRVLSGAGLIALVGVLFIAAQADDTKSRFRSDLPEFVKMSKVGDPGLPAEEADLDADSNLLKALGNFDGDADYLVARYLLEKRIASGEPLQLLHLAYQLTPSEKIGRALANAEEETSRPASAIETLNDALQRDPNNLSTLSTLMRLEMNSGDTTAAQATARRLIDVEKTPYFSVRSIPESVPTETYFARFDVLAPNQQDPKGKADLLSEGVRGMLPYADGTAKIIFHNSDQGKDPAMRMPGYDSLDEAKDKVTQTEKEAELARSLYLSMGDRAAAAEMDTDGRLLAADLAAISPK